MMKKKKDNNEEWAQYIFNIIKFLESWGWVLQMTERGRMHDG